MVRAIYPGSFDPTHFGHIDIAERAARIFDEVIIAVYDLPKKNLLFSVEDRVALARQAYMTSEKIKVAPFSGFAVDFAKKVGATVIVRGLRLFSDFEFEYRMGLANKKLAADIETVAIMSELRHIYISSSTVREIAELGGDVSEMVPPFVNEALVRRYAELRDAQ
ncbi:MAG: pantetheine-phosphate adenylyltransferase [Chloroflexota bacterium]|nr:pantetheine-phosphate adenylyltransferase [Chloroflexota bacterium]